MSIKLPQPDKDARRALLIPAGSTKKVATVHHYYDTRLIPDSVDSDGKPMVEYEFIWRCFNSGVERRWGTYVPSQPTSGASDNDVPVN